jgi:hypothetical protein
MKNDKGAVPAFPLNLEMYHNVPYRYVIRVIVDTLANSTFCNCFNILCHPGGSGCEARFHNTKQELSIYIESTTYGWNLVVFSASFPLSLLSISDTRRL